MQHVLFFEPEPTPMTPGARRGPQGIENKPKTRSRLYHFILPKVCPVKHTRAESGSSRIASGSFGPDRFECAGHVRNLLELEK